jgi:hypothetical protein
MKPDETNNDPSHFPEIDYLEQAHREQMAVTCARMRAPQVDRFGPPLRLTHQAWGVYINSEGEDPQLVAVFAEQAAAEKYAAQRDPDDPACGLFTDPQVMPVHAVVVFDNDFRADWFSSQREPLNHAASCPAHDGRACDCPKAISSQKE